MWRVDACSPDYQWLNEALSRLAVGRHGAFEEFLRHCFETVSQEPNISFGAVFV
jgi:hypothetical protein